MVPKSKLYRESAQVKRVFVRPPFMPIFKFDPDPICLYHEHALERFIFFTRLLPRGTISFLSRYPASVSHVLQPNWGSSSSSSTTTFSREQEDESDVVVPLPLPLTRQSPEKTSFFPGIGNKSAATLLLVTTASLAAMVSVPDACSALDLASLSGGAGAAVASGSTWLTRIGETGFYQAFTLVFLSEIGDKTFFIAGLLAMKTSRLISFVGSIGALVVMTLISVVIGQVFHAVPSGLADGIPLDDVAAVLAFAFFGFKTLQEALVLDEGSSTMDEELAEAEEAVEDNDAAKQGTILYVMFWKDLI